MVFEEPAPLDSKGGQFEGENSKMFRKPTFRNSMSRRSRHRCLVGLNALLMTSAFVVPAFAQEIETLIVTAEKKPEYEDQGTHHAQQ